ncbi:Mitochondrial import inner membrane translocase subunit TIM54 [Nakaseomyces glabratus]|nr:Inner membrane protein import complex subunit Tim54 [Nakaseomyces glabratus]KAJ9569371.1 mitochondrial import inner membrane translocase subunit tim54 [Nakaseomyces glabratus]QNG15085.1 TIM54 [Nakaseomyces glabratus]SCV13821.1 Mitochondrial import inner membrane translocase subunit TIM54 [Nakaseomyces glabratus]SLM12140.1 Mitochondrial import inner membrane translocase subunit TIM54 [Nakaseomyces glabratus]
MNPALKALGLGNFKLPSRNWTIFWTVLAGSLGGVGYDKYQQRQIISRYCDEVKPLSLQHCDVNKSPRKITVFIAPPPNDYLETSLKIWRRYIKPVLYYAGLDYEVIEEDRQGIIRSEVASRIRQLRRELLEADNEQQGNSGDSLLSIFKKPHAKDPEEEQKFDPEQARQFKADFDFRNVMGIYTKVPKLDTIVQTDSLVTDPVLAGGVVCVGRGAYKEYITGLHEGLLGPLDPPEETTQEVEMGSKLKSMNDGDNVETTVETAVETMVEATLESADKVEVEGKDTENEEGKDEPDEEKSRVLKPYLLRTAFHDTPIPPEVEPVLEKDVLLKDPKTNVPSLLHQPVLVIPVPNLIGFLTIPERIYRFYQRRFFVDEVCREASNLVKQEHIVKYEPDKHINLALEEESDWPKQWVKTGIEKNSEWTQELVQDQRVVSKMHVFELPKHTTKDTKE